MNSIRLNSMYDDSKLASLGDSLVNQSIDIALLFLHTFININKKRIIEGRPLSESRWDPSQKKSNQGIYQYKPELIFEAVIGALLHNVGEAHSLVHQIISGKPYFSDQSKNDQMKIKQIQKSTNVLKHLLDRDDISSITRMIAVMQKDYPDGTGYPSPNENRYLFEFVRLFQIKVYLYEKRKRNHPMYVGKVVSYPDSYFPMVAILKDEKNNRAYRDMIFGSERPLSKHL